MFGHQSMNKQKLVGHNTHGQSKTILMGKHNTHGHSKHWTLKYFARKNMDFSLKSCKNKSFSMKMSVSQSRILRGALDLSPVRQPLKPPQPIVFDLSGLVY